jgi:two-component system LytT family response regulator
MATLERRLDPRRFARIHRSTIVNLDRIREMALWFSGDYLVRLVDGTELKLSRWYWERLEERLR